MKPWFFLAGVTLVIALLGLLGAGQAFGVPDAWLTPVVVLLWSCCALLLVLLPVAVFMQPIFSLQEFTFSLLIIGALAALAVPFYQAGVEKAKFAEAFSLMSGAKNQITAYYAYNGRWPDARARLPGLKSSGNYVENLAIEDGGALTATLPGGDLGLRPALAAPAAQSVAWVCGTAQVPAGLHVQGENRTRLPAVYLSHTCR